MNIKCQGHSLTLVQGHSDSTFSNFFFLETAWPIEAKFYVEPPWDGGTKVWSNGLGHMTKMATMPIYGKNLKKSSSLEPKGRWLWKLMCCIGYSSTTKFVQMMTLGWPWPILWQGLCFCMGKGKTMDFSETVVVYDIKVGRCSQLMSTWSIMSTKGQGHSLTLVQFNQIQYF